MNKPDVLNVRQAANLLDVSEMQIGRLIRQGDLQASRFGRSWALEAASVHQYNHLRPHRGRPLSAPAAWEQLRHARPANLDQAKQVAAESRRRAGRHRLRVIPGLLAEAIADPAVVQGGADAALHHGASVSSPDVHVIYLAASHIQAFVADHHAGAAEDDANLIVRDVPDDLWSAVAADRYVSLPVAIADLLDLGDLRSAAEALRVRS